MATVLWIQAICCGGDTVSLLNADQPDVFTFFRSRGLQLLWHPSLSHSGPQDVQALFQRCADGTIELDLLAVEGAVGGAELSERGFFAAEARTASDWIRDLASRARVTVAIGTCASYGGMMVCGRNALEAKGLQFFRTQPGGLLGKDYRARSGLPVVNVAGCPAHPDWITGGFTALLDGTIAARDLDAFNRPRVFYSKLAHHGCPRNEYYEFKASALEYSQQGCLFENLGCKGTQCESDCNERLWLQRTGSCPRGGFPCLSCTSPKFPDGFAPFFATAKIGDIPTTLPLDVPKAWYVGMSGLAKLACPKRLAANAVSFRPVPDADADAKVKRERVSQ
ncbi:MAG: HupU protein [Planctomycetes bacterium]|nr:HupU protein [Planctomycetota bacterium]